MGLMNKVTKIAGKKAVEKIAASGIVDNAVNTIITKHNSAIGIKSTEESIKTSKRKNQLIIKRRSFSMDSVVSAFAGKFDNSNGTPISYRIYDCDGSLVYKCDSDKSILDQYIHNLYDSDNEKIGTISEPLVKLNISLIEKDVKKCAVYFESLKICELKKSIERISNIRYYESISGDVKITCCDHDLIQIQYKGRLVAVLRSVSGILKDDYVDKYIMEYDRLEDEVIGVLLALAVDIIT